MITVRFPSRSPSSISAFSCGYDDLSAGRFDRGADMRCVFVRERLGIFDRELRYDIGWGCIGRRHWRKQHSCHRAEAYQLRYSHLVLPFLFLSATELSRILCDRQRPRVPPTIDCEQKFSELR